MNLDSFRHRLDCVLGDPQPCREALAELFAELMVAHLAALEELTMFRIARRARRLNTAAKLRDEATLIWNRWPEGGI